MTFIKKITNSSSFWKLVSLSILSFFVISQVLPSPMRRSVDGGENELIVKTAHASDIYPMFSCPCCGQPLDKDKPCCGAAVEMINFIDQKLGEGLGDDEIILATAKLFGIERLIAESDKTALRQKLIDLE